MLLLAHMEINIIIDKEFKKYVKPIWLRSIAKLIIVTENIGTPKIEMGLVITGDEKMRELNLKYLDEDRPTDVLSFPMYEASEIYTIGLDDKIHPGEIIISYPTAARQATEHHHPVSREITILLIHGILHLLGYDHDILQRKQVMQNRESAILKTIEEQGL